MNNNPESKNQRSEQLLDKALRKEPDFLLSVDFADRVLMQLDKRREQAGVREWVWFGVGLFGFLSAAIVGIVLSGFRPSVGALTFISSHGGLFIFGISFILALQWIDRRFVRKAGPAV